MAKIQILGDAAVITSGISTDTLVKLGKFNPKALKTVDKETKNELFAVAQGYSAHVSQAGIVFNSTNEAGFAQATVSLPWGLDNSEKLQFVQNEYGLALLQLNALEAQVAEAGTTLEADFATVVAATTIIE